MTAHVPARGYSAATRTTSQGKRGADWLVIGSVSAGALGNFALLYYVQPLLPDLAIHFGVGAADSGWALSVSTLAMLVGLFLARPLADRFGSGTVMAASLALAGLVTAASAAAPTWSVFLVCRAAAGLALAGFPAVALASLRDRTGKAHHGHANAIYISATAVGGAVARLLPGPLDLVGGWQLPTLILGGFCGVMGAFVACVFPRRPVQPVTRGARSLGGVFRALANRQIALLCAIGALNMAVYVALFNAISFRLQSDTMNSGGASTAVYGSYLVGLAGPLVFHRFSLWFGRWWSALIGVGLIALAVGVLMPSGLWAELLGIGALAFSFMGTHSVLSGWVVDTAHRSHVSPTGASSAYLILYYLASTVSGAAITRVWVLSGWAGVTEFGFVLAGTSAAALTALGVIRRSHRETSP